MKPSRHARRPAAPGPGFLRRAMAFALVPAALAAGACDSAGQLETRTFDLVYLDPQEAEAIVRPYVYDDREGAPGMIASFPSGITVRERPEALDRIAEVLARYDREKPGIRLHFQLIEADGFTEQDLAIADVRDALDALFRFEGYRLAAETQLAMVEGTRASQPIAGSARPYSLAATLLSVRVHDDGGGSVTVMVRLASGVMDDGIATTLTVPLGETVVLGSARRAASEPTLILTVRPERVTS